MIVFLYTYILISLEYMHEIYTSLITEYVGQAKLALQYQQIILKSQCFNAYPWGRTYHLQYKWCWRLATYLVSIQNVFITQTFPQSSLQRALEESKTVSGVLHSNSYMCGLELKYVSSVISYRLWGLTSSRHQGSQGFLPLCTGQTWKAERVPLIIFLTF